jgi:hypothetical protein
VGCPLCDFGGDATGSDETTRARAVSFGDAGESEKKQKKQKTFGERFVGGDAPWPLLST